MHQLQHILIIDDDQINNLFSQIILEDADVSKLVSICHSVPEALDFLRDAETNQHTDFPDLILLDISMPTLNGFDFLDSYYSLGYQQRHHTFVSMFTSSDEQEHVERAHKYDVVVGFIKKPLSIPSLNAILALQASNRAENDL